MLMTTALCASPAARMRRGRDERRAEGAVTCGRATRACGAAHTFLSLLFFLLRPGRADTCRATHTSTHSSLSLCGSDCGSSVVYGSGCWCLGEGRGAERAEEAAPAGRD
ncbi:ATPase [Trypanosoma cruzi]|nr:ATPase [Trypanosoma cruzi]